MIRYPLYIFDLDGTLFRGNDPIDGAVEALAQLRREGAEVRYLTNNSTQARETYVQKLSHMGFEVQPEWVYSSALGTAEYLRGEVRSAFVVGEEGLCSALRNAGVEITAASGEQVEAVVVGLCRTFTYSLMSDALEHLLDLQVRFVATNRDATYPLEGGRLIPGAGAIVASLVEASGREPELVGKPSPFLVEWILRDARIAPDKALVVGDRIDTDLEAGRRAGCPVHLVLTGVTPIAPAAVSWSVDLRALIQ